MAELFCKDLGPAVVEWNTTAIGEQLGDVVVKSETTFVDIKENQHGNAPVDAVETGRVVTVEVPLTRTTLAEIDAVFPESTLAGNVITFGNPVGGNMFDSAQALVIKPETNQAASATDTEWLTFFKTYPIEVIELPFGTENQRVFNITFKVFPSDTSPNVGDLYKWGE